LPTWYSAATLKSLEGHDNLENIRKRKGLIFADNGTAKFEAAYPVVNTACMTTSLMGLTSDTGIPFFGIDGNFSSNITTLGDLVNNASRFIASDGARRYYAPVWLTSPDPKLTSMVGIFLYQFLDGADSQPLSRILELAGEGKVFHDEDHSIQILTCTISPYWELGEVELHATGRESTVQTRSYARKLSTNARGISVNVTELNENARLHLRMTQAILKSQADNSWNGWTKNLATAFALAVARIPDVPIVKNANDEGFYVAGLVHEIPPGRDAANITTFRYIMVDYGFGYGTRSVSIYLAMAVMITYCILTVSYMAYTIVTGRSSTAWSLGIELVTLALQSRRPDHLGHVSVGIDSINTLAEPVGIRVNSQNELELVFAHDRDLGSRDLRKIARNKEY
jgi:hypothetical protein